MSQNAARLLVGVLRRRRAGAASSCPINFRLNAEEVALHRRALRRLGAAGRPRAGRRRRRRRRASTASMLGHGHRRRAVPPSAPSPSRGTPDEDATATINYTTGTTARPKGVQLTHRNLWLNAATFGWHTGVTRPRRLPAHAADVPLQRLGHAVRHRRHGRDAGRAAQGRRRRDPAPRRRARRHAAVRRAGGRGRGPRRRRRRGTGRSPARGRTRIVVAGAPPPTRTIERVETELGWEFIQIYGLTETAPLLTMNRGRAEWDDLAPGERAAAARAGPARRRSASSVAVDDQGEVLARSNVVLDGLLGPARGHRRRHRRRLVPHRRRRHASTTRATSRSPTARRT